MDTLQEFNVIILGQGQTKTDRCVNWYSTVHIWHDDDMPYSKCKLAYPSRVQYKTSDVFWPLPNWFHDVGYWPHIDWNLKCFPSLYLGLMVERLFVLDNAGSFLWTFWSLTNNGLLISLRWPIISCRFPAYRAQRATKNWVLSRWPANGPATIECQTKHEKAALSETLEKSQSHCSRHQEEGEEGGGLY